MDDGYTLCDRRLRIGLRDGLRSKAEGCRGRSRRNELQRYGNLARCSEAFKPFGGTDRARAEW